MTQDTPLVNEENDQLTNWMYFPTFVGTIKKLNFLDIVKEVSTEYLGNRKSSQKELNEIYPVYMTDNYFHEEKIREFVDFIGKTAWDILNGQGYNMENLGVSFTEMWTQEHYKHSAMEQHVHGYGSQLSGFYFLDVPEGSSKVVFHDPRPGKVQINLPEKDISNATYGSNMINFTPEPGMLMITNSWLPHSFTRHGAEDPIRFVHFNLVVMQQPQTSCPAPAEVV
jgi:uncharacterized protein (TIGR02466 family)